VKDRNHAKLAFASAENQRHAPSQNLAHLRDEGLKYGRVPGACEQQHVEAPARNVMLVQFVHAREGHGHMAQPADGTAHQLSGSKYWI
jgi:hypothetical protein